MLTHRRASTTFPSNDDTPSEYNLGGCSLQGVVVYDSTRRRLSDPPPNYWGVKPTSKLGTIGGGDGRSGAERSDAAASFRPISRKLDNAMAFQSAPDCAEAVIKHTLSGQAINNVLNFRHAGGYSLSDLQNLGDAVDAAWDANMMPQLNTSLIYTGVLVRGLEFEADQEVFVSTSAGTGSIGGIVATNNVAFVLTERTGFTGRSSRGRIYLGGLASSDFTSSDTISTARAAAFVAAMEAVQALALTEGWEHVVLSRFHNGAKRLTATALPITSYEARNLFTDSQRGRLPAGH